MIKALFFADSHLGFDFPVHPRISRNRRGIDFFNNYNVILETARAEQVDVLIHGGDVFFRSKIPLPIIQKTYEPLLPLLESGMHMLFVPGNHERSKLPATPLFHHPNFHLFDQPKKIVMKINGTRVIWGGFPNVRQDIQDVFPKFVNDVGFDDGPQGLRILCMHQAVQHAVVGAQNYTFRKGSDVIGLDQIPDSLDLILSGHIHRHQILRTKQGTPILYPGSIERTSFAERFETKGFMLLHLSESSVDWEFRALSTRTMHEVVLAADLTTTQDMVYAVLKSVETLSPDIILKVRTTTTQQLAHLKIAELRKLLPETMHITVAPPYQNRITQWSAYSD